MLLAFSIPSTQLLAPSNLSILSFEDFDDHRQLTAGTQASVP